MNFVAKREWIRNTLSITNTFLGIISAVLHSLSNIVTIIINEAHGVLTNIYMNSLVLVAPLPGSYTVFTTLNEVKGDMVYAAIIAIVIELSIGGLSYLVVASLATLRKTAHEWAMWVLIVIWIALLAVVFMFVIEVDKQGDINPMLSILLLLLPVLLLPAIAIANLFKIQKKALTFNDAFPGENLMDREDKSIKLSDVQTNILIALVDAPLSKSEISTRLSIEVTKILNKAGRGPLADLMLSGHVVRIGEGIKTKYELTDAGKIVAMSK